MPYYIYILRSLKDGKLYTGHTSDLVERLLRHNEGRVKSTKNRRPLELIYFEEHDSRSSAMKRESYLKSPEGGPLKSKLIEDFERNQLDDFLKKTVG